MSLKKTPYSVIRDLGKIVPKKYFIEFEIEGKDYLFKWDEPKIMELLELIRDIDFAFERTGEKKGLKYQVSVAETVFNFLHKINPTFTKMEFNALSSESVNTIIETIIDPFISADQKASKQVKGDGDLAKKKALKTPALD